jgi:hypothetical protein
VVNILTKYTISAVSFDSSHSTIRIVFRKILFLRRAVSNKV